MTKRHLIVLTKNVYGARVIKSATTEKWNEIQWILWSQLDDPDFTDDIMAHTQQQMQEKTNLVAELSSSTGLSIHSKKSKVL